MSLWNLPAVCDPLVVLNWNAVGQHVFHWIKKKKNIQLENNPKAELYVLLLALVMASKGPSLASSSSQLTHAGFKSTVTITLRMVAKHFRLDTLSQPVTPLVEIDFFCLPVTTEYFSPQFKDYMNSYVAGFSILILEDALGWMNFQLPNTEASQPIMPSLLTAAVAVEPLGLLQIRNYL